MSIRFTPASVARTKTALERVRLELMAIAPVAAEAGGRVLAADMAAKAPRDTGALAASIIVEIEGETAHVGSTLPYARFVQYGTRYMAAQPFETEAATEVQARIVTTIAALLKAVIH
jgi:HK97 gp10 family phage protein